MTNFDPRREAKRRYKAAHFQRNKLDYAKKKRLRREELRADSNTAAKLRSKQREYWRKYRGDAFTCERLRDDAFAPITPEERRELRAKWLERFGVEGS